jgi:hypothetical protein
MATNCKNLNSSTPYKVNGVDVELAEDTVNIDNTDHPFTAVNRQVIFADCSLGDIDITLPDQTVLGNRVTVIRTDSSANTLTADSTPIKKLNLSYTFHSNGTDYYII